MSVNLAGQGSIALGGVSSYNQTLNKEITCDVVKTNGLWECGMGAIVGTDNATLVTSLDSSDAINYITGANTNDGTTFQFDTLHNFIVAPAKTFEWFNTTFNFTKNCILADEETQPLYQTVSCPLGAQNKKDLYIVMLNKNGSQVPNSALWDTKTKQFNVRFWKDATVKNWILGQQFLDGKTAIFDLTASTVTVTGGNFFDFSGLASSSKTIYIIVGIAVAVAAIAIAIVIYCCCCKKNEGDDYREQK